MKRCQSGRKMTTREIVVEWVMQTLMRLANAAASVSTEKVLHPGATSTAGWRSRSSEHAVRVRVVNKTYASAATPTRLMRNQLDLSSRHSGHYKIWAHLPYLIFVENRFQLLLLILCSQSSLLPFSFSFIFRFFCCIVCEILKFFLCLNLLSFHPAPVLRRHYATFIHPFPSH